MGCGEGIGVILLCADDGLGLLLDFLRKFILLEDLVEADLPTMSLCDARPPQPRIDLVTDACRRVSDSGSIDL